MLATLVHAIASERIDPRPTLPHRVGPTTSCISRFDPLAWPFASPADISPDRKILSTHSRHSLTPPLTLRRRDVPCETLHRALTLPFPALGIGFIAGLVERDGR